MSDDAVGSRGVGPIGLVSGHSRVVSAEFAAFIWWWILWGTLLIIIYLRYIRRGSFEGVKIGIRLKPAGDIVVIIG